MALNLFVNGMFHVAESAVGKVDVFCQKKKDVALFKRLKGSPGELVLEIKRAALSSSFKETSSFMDVERKDSLFYRTVKILETVDQRLELLTLLQAQKCLGKDPKKVFEIFLKNTGNAHENELFEKIALFLQNKPDLLQAFLRAFLTVYKEEKFKEALQHIPSSVLFSTLKCMIEDSSLQPYVMRDFLSRVFAQISAEEVLSFYQVCKVSPLIMEQFPFEDFFRKLPEKQIPDLCFDLSQHKFLEGSLRFVFLSKIFSNCSKEDVFPCFQMCTKDPSLMSQIPFEVIFQKIPKKDLKLLLLSSIRGEQVQPYVTKDFLYKTFFSLSDEDILPCLIEIPDDLLTQLPFSQMIPRISPQAIRPLLDRCAEAITVQSRGERSKVLREAFSRMPPANIFACFCLCKDARLIKELPVEIFFERIPSEDVIPCLRVCANDPSFMNTLPFELIFQRAPKETIGPFVRDCMNGNMLPHLTESFLFFAFLSMSQEDVFPCLRVCKNNPSIMGKLSFGAICTRISKEKIQTLREDACLSAYMPLWLREEILEDVFETEKFREPSQMLDFLLFFQAHRRQEQNPQALFEHFFQTAKHVSKYDFFECGMRAFQRDSFLLNAFLHAFLSVHGEESFQISLQRVAVKEIGSVFTTVLKDSVLRDYIELVFLREAFFEMSEEAMRVICNDPNLQPLILSWIEKWRDSVSMELSNLGKLQLNKRKLLLEIFPTLCLQTKKALGFDEIHNS